MRDASRIQMTREAGRWRDLGLIDAALAAQLEQRYDRRGHMLAVLLKWLGVFAMVQLALAVGAFIAISSESAWLGALMLAALSAVAWRQGVTLATDPLARHPITASALVTAALAAGLGALALGILAVGGELDHPVDALLLGAGGAASIATAYRHHLRWPLLLGLLLVFHAIGAWHAYVGGGGYVADIAEPVVMAPLAFAVVLFGLWHERVAEHGAARRAEGFGHLYLVIGLVYANLSLWFLTIPRGPFEAVVLFTAASIVQIVAGARLADARLTGFGIVFLSIDLYTRYFEHFRDRHSLGVMLAIGGAAALLAGYAFERRASSRRAGGAA